MDHCSLQFYYLLISLLLLNLNHFTLGGFFFVLIVSCGPSFSRSPRWSGGHVTQAPLDDALTCSVILLDPQYFTIYIFCNLLVSAILSICKLCCCCSVLYTWRLLHVGPSWDRDPSSPLASKARGCCCTIIKYVCTLPVGDVVPYFVSHHHLPHRPATS